MPDAGPPRGRLGSWFPFTAGEIEFALGLCGFAVAMLALIEVPTHDLFAGAVAFLVIAYLAGLLVYARRDLRVFDFIEDGGLRGQGYVEFFRVARHSLFLTHTDDDPPGEELLGLYRSLLSKGVQLRRVTFVRPRPCSTEWLAEFGEHKNLEQRVLPPGAADPLPLSFAVVDEEAVIVSVPGYDAIDDPGYSARFVLRHLLVIHDRDVARVFLEIHRYLWTRAEPLRLRSGQSG